LGRGVEKDAKKEIYFHLEEAAIGGHPTGCQEGNNGRIERAVKHWIIAANQGCVDSIQELRGEYADGTISKESFAAALRAHPHQAAVDATKSPQRDAAIECFRNQDKNDAEDC